MSAIIEIDIDKTLQSKSEQIKELRLALKETTILLTASTAAEKRLMECIRTHKRVMFGDTLPPFPDDAALYELLGEEV